MGIKHVLQVGILALLVGCATPVEQQDDVNESISDVKSDMSQARTQIDKTLSSLNALMTAPPETLQAAYKRYAEDVEELKENAEAVAENSDELQENRDEWLATWEKSQGDVQSAELKAVSAERRAQVSERLKNIDRSIVAARNAYTPLVENLDDVMVVVGSDLTPKGVASVANTDVVRNAFRYGEQVDNSLESAIVEFDELAKTLSPPKK